MPKENVKQGIEMMADAFINASLEQEAVDQERKAILEEYNLSKDNAQRLVYDRLYSLAYPKGHPYHSSVIGTETNLRSFQSADLQRFRDLFYAPERSVVTVVGDVNPHEVMAQLREQFGEFRRVASRPIRRVSNSEPPADTVAQNMEGNIKNSVIIMGYVGPSVHDKPDIYRMDVASFLLGIGRGSIINREVVETQKAFVAGVDFLTQRFSGLVLMHAIASPDKLEETKQALLASIQRLKNGEISERDLKRAKNFLRGNFQLGNESNAGKAESLGFYAVLGEEDFPEEYCAQLENVTLEDVVNVANKYFNDGFYSVTMVHEEPKVVRRSRLDDYDGMGRWTGGRR